MNQISLRQKLSKYDRIKILNKSINNIKETVYPDNYDEAKEAMIEALEDRIDAIVQDRV